MSLTTKTTTYLQEMVHKAGQYLELVRIADKKQKALKRAPFLYPQSFDYDLQTLLLTDEIKSRTCLNPFYLLSVQGVVRHEGVRRTICMG